MRTTFIAANPREKARALLDKVLSAGTDQVAVACAFLTEGGAEVLKRHQARLKLPGSFVVAAWEPPTSEAALAALHKIAPGNIYIHLGVKTPVEKAVGRGLMHSKVFLARSGKQCWLWTGSHNLTASAMGGINLEAAVLVEGTQEEQPFKDALAHLTRCKDEAVVFDPFNLPPPHDVEQTIVIHAEQHTTIGGLPRHIHLCLDSTELDRALRPPAGVWLYLYRPGTLRAGAPRPAAATAYSGRLTALNFTEKHPSEKGIVADWTTADFIIEPAKDVFHLLKKSKPATTAYTQAVFHIDKQVDPTILWLTEEPRPTLRQEITEPQYESVDKDLSRFFTKGSLRQGKLLRREIRALRRVFEAPDYQFGNLTERDVIERMALTAQTEVRFRKVSVSDREAFIYRAKYRVGAKPAS